MTQRKWCERWKVPRAQPRGPLEVPAAILAEVPGPQGPIPAAAGPREDRTRVGVGREEENAT